MKEIIKFFTEYLLLLITALGIGFLFWYYKPQDTISISWFISLSVAPLLLNVLLVRHIALSYLDQKPSNILPKLKLMEDDKYIFEASDLFSSQAFVSLYLIGETERFIAFGKIETVVSNTNNLQVIILGFETNFDKEFIEKHKNQIALKPIIPYENVIKLIQSSQGE